MMAGASRLSGADVVALRDLGDVLDHAAEALVTSRGAVETAVDAADWWGPGGEQFRAEWAERHAPALIDASERLARTADIARQNADDQEQTSQDPGDAHPGGGPQAAPVSYPVPANGDGSGEPEGPDDGGRRDQGRESTDDRRGRGDDDSAPDGDHGIPGPDPYPGGLGEPVSGETAPGVEPPAWSPPDAGSGEHGVEEAGFWDRRLEDAIEGAAHGSSAVWPDASRNLLHYLDNSGETLEQPVDAMLEDLPTLDQVITEWEHDLGADAIDRAQASGADGPVTFPVNTGWEGYYAGADENKNWFYATGGFQYNLNGQVTVYPPDTPGGEWTYQAETVVNTRDRYNWDGGKSTEIGPLTVTDEQLQELHRKGLAQEFTMVGTSSPRTSEGTG